MSRRRDRWLKRGLEWLLRPFFHRPQLSLEQIAAEKPQRILIVRQHNQMGDMLCAVPAIRAIAETFSGASLAIVTAPVNDGVVRGNPYLERVFLFDKVSLRRSPLRALRFIRSLRTFAPELAIVLNSVSYSGTSSWIAVLSGSRRIIGGDSRPFGWSFSQWLYNLQMPSSKTVQGHAIDHGLRPLASIGITTQDRSTILILSEEDEQHAARFLQDVGEAPYFAVHPGAGKQANRWPAARFAQMVQRLRAAGFSPWCVEGPADGEATAQLQALLRFPLPVLRGVSVRTVAAALAASDLALVNDTGIMHVAGAVGVPTLALFGPTPARSWKPPGRKVVALQSADGTMEGLSEDQVQERLSELHPLLRGGAGSARISSTSRDSSRP
jgi:heptosyltransferase-2